MIVARRRELLLLLCIAAAAAACSSGFDAKRQVEVLDSRVGPHKNEGGDATSDTPDAARTKLINEAFVMIPVATDIDPFPRRPKVNLPADSKLHYSIAIKAFGSGDKSMRYQTHGVAIQTPMTYERFDRDIAPLVSDSAALPNGTALLFTWTTNGGGVAAQGWDAVPVRMPPLATARDIAGATPEMHETRKLNPDGKTFHVAFSQAVRVTLTPDATTRLSRWGQGKEELPIATAVKGRIMDVSVLGGATSVYLELEWLAEEERKSAAELLAAELRNAAGH